MTIRSIGPSAGFDWLKRGLTASYRHPRPLLGGAALLILSSLLPSMITLPLQVHQLGSGSPPTPATFAWLMAGSMLLGLLLVPLYAGYLQVIDAAERGLPARARDIFMPYRNGEAFRLIGYGLAMVVVYIALFGIVIAAAGSGIASWYMQVLTAQASRLPPPALPPGFGIAMVLFTLIGLLMLGFYAVSLGQIALRRRSVFGAIADGAAGALKNLLPLFVFAVSALVAWVAAGIAIVVVAMLLALIAQFVGAWLVFVLIVPLYIAMMLAIFAVMFGVMYHLWRDVCGGDAATDAVPQIAL